MRLKVQIDQAEKRAEDWNEIVKEIIDFSFAARETFLNCKDIQKKKEIVFSLGSNLIIKDGKVALELNNTLR